VDKSRATPQASSRVNVGLLIAALNERTPEFQAEVRNSVNASIKNSTTGELLTLTVKRKGGDPEVKSPKPTRIMFLP
jgi:hypothetical protein